jgi:uncharacterized membrane protein
LGRKKALSDLDRMLERWTAAGLITADQARAIRATEKRDGRTSQAIPSIAEVIAYVGAIFALSSVGFIASEVWEDIALGAQVGLVALVTGLFWIGGWWIQGGGSPVRERLATVLWFISAGGFGWLADLVATDILDVDNGYALIIGLALSLYAGLLYNLRRTPLQQIALAGGVGFVCAGLSDVVGGDDWFGLFLWLAGAGWIALTREEVLIPRRTGFALGALGVLIGSEAVALNFFDSPDALGLILGLASAAALLYLSVSLSEMVLLGFGTVGLAVFVIHIIGEYLADGLGGAAALLVAGLALLLVALLAVRLKDRAKPEAAG